MTADDDFYRSMLANTSNTNLPLDPSDAIDAILVNDEDLHRLKSHAHHATIFAHSTTFTDDAQGHDATAYRRMMNPSGDLFLEELLIILDGLEAQIIALGPFGADVNALFDMPTQAYRFALLQEYAHRFREFKHLRLLHHLSKHPVPSPAEWSAILSIESDKPTPTPTRIQTPNTVAAMLLEHPRLPKLPCDADTRQFQIPKILLSENDDLRAQYKYFLVNESQWRMVRAGSYEVWVAQLLAAAESFNALPARNKGRQHALLLDDRIPLPTVGNFAGWAGIATLRMSHVFVPSSMTGDVDHGMSPTKMALYERLATAVGFVPAAVITYMTPMMPGTYEHKSASHAQTIETEYHHSLNARNKAHDHDEYERICYGFAKLETVVVGMETYRVMASTDIKDSAIGANIINAQHRHVFNQFLNMRTFTRPQQTIVASGVFDPYMLDESPLPCAWPLLRADYAVDTGYRALASSYAMHFRIDSQEALIDWRNAYCNAAATYVQMSRFEPERYYRAITKELAAATVIRPKLQTQVTMSEKEKNRKIADEVFGEIFGDSF